MLGRVFLSLLMITGLTGWASAASVSEGFRVRGLAAADAAARGIIISPGDEILPQIANGELEGGQTFFTIFQLVNFTSQDATITVLFFDDEGNSMSLPLDPGDGGPAEDFIGVEADIPARGFGLIVTVPTGADVRIGFAAVFSDPENSVGVTATFSNQVPGERAYQASVPLTSQLHGEFFMPYLNEEPFVSSMAVVSVLPQNVTFIARDPDGVEECRVSEAFAGGAHRAFLISALLPCTAGKNGSVEVQGSASLGLAAIGFNALDGGLGAFVTQPVWGALPEL